MLFSFILFLNNPDKKWLTLPPVLPFNRTNVYTLCSRSSLSDWLDCFPALHQVFFKHDQSTSDQDQGVIQTFFFLSFSCLGPIAKCVFRWTLLKTSRNTAHSLSHWSHLQLQHVKNKSYSDTWRTISLFKIQTAHTDLSLYLSLCMCRINLLLLKQTSLLSCKGPRPTKSGWI